MKTKQILKFIPILLCCLVAGVLTSCLNDDNDDNGLTPNERHEAFLSVAGTYTGKMLFYDRKVQTTSGLSNSDVDTLNVSWTLLSDSTARVNIPLEALSHQVKDTVVANALKNATPKNVTINCSTLYYSLDPVAFVLAPGSASVALNYGGSSHNLVFQFYYGTTTSGLISYGAYSTAMKQLMIRMQLGGLSIDATDRSSTALFQDGIHGTFILYGNR